MPEEHTLAGAIELQQSTINLLQKQYNVPESILKNMIETSFIKGQLSK